MGQCSRGDGAAILHIVRHCLRREPSSVAIDEIAARIKSDNVVPEPHRSRRS